MAPKKPQPTAGQATMLSFFKQKPAGKTGEKEVKENKRPPQEEAPAAATKTKRPKSDFFSDEDEDFQQETKSRFFQSSKKKDKEASKAVPKSAEEMFGKTAVKRSNALPASATQKAEKKTETKQDPPQPETPSKRITRSATNTPSKEASGTKTDERGSKRSTHEEREEVRTPGRKRAKVEEEEPTPKKRTPKTKTPAKVEKKEKPVMVFEKKEKPVVVFEKKEKSASEKKEKPVSEKKERPTVEKKEKAVAVEKEEKGKEEGGTAEKELPAKKKFWELKNREGPRALGSRDIPTGNANSLQGMTFVVTGELECITRDDWTDLIKRLGGRVTMTISKKTDYVVVGRDPGQSKLAKAGQCGTKQLTEEEFYTLAETLPAKGDYVPPPDKTKEKTEKPKLVAPKDEGSSKRSVPAWVSKEEADTTPVLAPTKQKPAETKPAAIPTPTPTPPPAKAGTDASNLWVDRHKPKSVKDIIGNKTNVDKLTEWLKGWQANHTGGAAKQKGAAKGAYGKGKQDASSFKAVLISGPPGIGKTTAAGLVAAECGYDVIEMNASDTRSKSSLRDEVSDLLDNRAITEFYSKSSATKTAKRSQLLIMDEVDGMSAGDRGGMQELIQLIKSTKVPIICLCNDHSSRKVRSLINYCFDLRFARPNINQIKGKMMGICFKEGISIEPNALEQLITATNNDIRQIINQLSVWRLSGEKLTYDGVKEKLQNARKDTVGSLGVFDAIRLVYTKSESDRMALDDRLRMYYIDDMVPLMSQENYLQFVPSMAMDQPTPRRQEAKAMDLISAAADSFCDADIIDGVKRRQNAWGLMPNHGVAALVRPAYFMKGHMKGWQMNFPSWLGNYSKTSRCDRLLRELQVHVRTHASCSASEINQWYLPLLKTCMVQPLVTRGAEGVDDVMGTLEAYTLTREDWDTVQELTAYKGVTSEPKIDSKAKAAFTRTYNANPHMLPYAEKAALPKRAAASAPSEAYAEDEETGQVKEVEVDVEEEEEEGEEEEGVGKDKMIKAKVATKAGAAGKKAAGGAAAKKAPAKPRKK